MSSRAGAALATVVVAMALSACIGTVSQGELTAEVQQRGGGITRGLVDDAIEAVADETGADPLAVHSINATLAQVAIVVPAADGTGSEEWTYGTSGLYGGKGLDGPVPVQGAAPAAFTVRPGDWDVDAGTETARTAAGPGVWVGAVHIARITDDAEPVAVVAVSGADEAVSVVVDPRGAVVPEGLR